MYFTVHLTTLQIIKHKNVCQFVLVIGSILEICIIMNVYHSVLQANLQIIKQTDYVQHPAPMDISLIMIRLLVSNIVEM